MPSSQFNLALSLLDRAMLMIAIWDATETALLLRIEFHSQCLRCVLKTSATATIHWLSHKERQHATLTARRLASATVLSFTWWEVSNSPWVSASKHAAARMTSSWNQLPHKNNWTWSQMCRRNWNQVLSTTDPSSRATGWPKISPSSFKPSPHSSFAWAFSPLSPTTLTNNWRARFKSHQRHSKTLRKTTRSSSQWRETLWMSSK